MELIEARFLQLRNLEQTLLAPAPGINFIVGANGSGKTSVLEGIYLLGMARSFRTARLVQAICWRRPGLRVNGRLRTADGLILGVGVGNDRHETRVRVGGESVPSRADLAARVPMQYIGSETQGFFDAGPGFRRKHLDWAVFHLEPGFYPTWQRFQRVLKQRNAALRQGIASNALKPWHGQMAEYATGLDQVRRRTVERLLPHLSGTLARLLPGFEIAVDYRPGWNVEIPYQTLLRENYAQDRRLGYTVAGPQRCDLRVRHAGVDAGQSLSRGQKRLFGIGFLLAQARLLEERQGRRSIVLFDDLHAELDPARQAAVIEVLSDQGNQAFVSAVAAPSAAGTYFQIDAGRVRPA